ncbi:MAG TPA: methyltransferase domain-containing protein [Anaerolineales bacterium]|nr:methyltransferase domain-containing protein [Anaerolineales bacterium]
MLPFTPADWHRRFTRQAQWTRALRDYLLPRVGEKSAARTLEVGCGTGAVLTELSETLSFTAGLDVNFTYLNLAMRNTPQARLTQGDAHTLPYASNNFDLTLCHFLLLWVDDPLQVISEMVRVTRSGGAVLALAEPDYGGRIDYPVELGVLGDWQRASLRRQGADPLMGRRLAGLFHQAGIEAVETGILGAQWPEAPDQETWESEWAVLESDLSQISEILEIPEMTKLKELDRMAHEKGERVLFVPTFYAWGRVS